MSVLAWPVVVSLAAGTGSLSLVVYLLQYREKPGARLFVVALAAQAVFCFAYGIGLTVFDEGLREWFEVVAVVALNWIGAPFLGFAFAYTGRANLLRSWAYRAFYLPPLAVSVLLPFNGRHHLYWSEFEIDSIYGVATATYTFEPLFYLTFLSGTTIAGVGALLLLDTVWSFGPLYRGEALAVGLSFVPPTVGLFLWLFGVGPAEQLNVAVLLWLPHVVLDGYAFVGSGMFEFHPATSRAAERAALDDLRQPVLVLDEAGRVVELNTAAESLFGVDQATAVTRPVSAIVGEDIRPDVADRRLSVHSESRREYRVDSSPLTDSGDNHVGYLLLFQDVTEEVKQKEQLAVLNRVLRHNLRNKLTVAKGHIDVAAETASGEETTNLDKASGALTNLLDTSEQAREVERILGGDETVREPVRIRALIGEVVDSAPPAATVSVDCPPITVRTDRTLFGAVIGQLFENAVEHGGPDPTVEIRIEHDDRLTVEIEDDGPGIPDHELRVLETEETALEHGSGLGLWLIKWAAERLGGEISFETTGEGTRAVLSLPATVVEKPDDTTPATGRPGSSEERPQPDQTSSPSA